MDAARPTRSGPGFGIVVGAFLLTGLLAPGWMWWNARRRAEISSNERAAFHAVGVLAALEAEFRAGDLDKNGVQDFWIGDVAGLLAFTGPTEKSGVDDPELARADPSRPDARPYHGYWFAPLNVAGGGAARHPTSYAFCAYPDRQGVTGRKTFVINELHTVAEGDTGGAPPPSWPGDAELKRAWSFGGPRDR